MSQRDLFEGRRLRDEAIDAVGGVDPEDEARQAWVAAAKVVAMHIARDCGSVTSDDVRLACPIPTGVDPRILGAVFKGLPLRRRGYRETQFRQAHGRPISVWVLDPEKNNAAR